MHRVPNEGCVLVLWVEVMLGREDAAYLRNGFLVEFRVADLHHQVVDPTFENAGTLLGREVTRHGRVRNEELGVVWARAITAVLLLLFEDTDHGVRRAIHGDNLAHGGLAAK